VANTLNVFRHGAVGFIDWLDVGAFIACGAEIKATKRAGSWGKKAE